MPRRGSIGGLLLLLGGIAVCSVAFAEEPPTTLPVGLTATTPSELLQAERRAHAFEPPELGFYGKHWLPRMERSISRLTPVFDRPDIGLPVESHLLYDDVQDAASGRIRNATVKAFRDYMFETTALGRIASFDLTGKKRREQERAADQAEESSPISLPRRRPRLDLRLSDRESRVSVGLPSNVGYLRFGVGTRGSVSMAVKNVRNSRSAFVADYDPTRERIRLSVRMEF